MGGDQTSNIGKLTNVLRDLEKFGQSPWLDFIQRSFTHDGSLQKLVDEDGLRGVTSNPAIFEKAMGYGSDYDEQIDAVLRHRVVSAGELYETLAITDIQATAEILRPVYDQTNGLDGYVSLEVSPYLAYDSSATLDEARRLWRTVDRENLMIKIPGTPEGVPAFEAATADGISVNVTLLFSLEAYKQVLEAYLRGLERRLARGESLERIASVASFFVSRIDSKIDAEIDRRTKEGDAQSDALAKLRGRVAIANAKLAYQHYLEVKKSPRWQKLAQAGARPQRLLWASTGTKDKAYSDVLYVEELVGSETVNTIPPATFDAFRDHGKLRSSLTEDIAQAQHVMSEQERLGLNLDHVTKILVDEGCASFCDAFDKLLGAVARKQQSILKDKRLGQSMDLPAALKQSVDDAIEVWRKTGKLRKLWQRDASVWTNHDEAKWLKWLDIVEERYEHFIDLEAFSHDVKQRGFTDILLLGMGGSSLGPEVIAETFSHDKAGPALHVLDSTDPQQIAHFEQKVDLTKTLFIVASKSGGTLEPNILLAYFFAQAENALGRSPGKRFVAITDPGSHLETVAKRDGFWKVFHGDPEIGGRFSVLSNFGLVPAAASGIDIKQFLLSALQAVKASSASNPPAENEALKLGVALGVAANKYQRDKVTFIASPQVASLGTWLEQLIAESTGKLGKGLIPIEGEDIGSPESYQDDRIFAYLRDLSAPSREQDQRVAALKAAGHPVVTVDLAHQMALSQAFFHWEFATAVAGAELGINPFDQPDVEASKVATKKLTQAYSETGKLPPEAAFAKEGGLSFFADEANQKALGVVQGSALLEAHFSRLKSHDYVALLAYIERDDVTRKYLQEMRHLLRERYHVATAAEFGPRFLHSTGQAYKGGPASGVFLQITADDQNDLAVPGERFTFGVVKAAQARGDFDVLSERGRRALRVHISGPLIPGLESLMKALKAAL